MLLAYVDESYCDDRSHMAAALAWHPSQAAFLYDRLQATIAWESQRLGISLPDEVHGYELFQGRGAWEGVSLQERLLVAYRVPGAVRAAGVAFIIRRIDRAAQRRRYPGAYEPYPMILTYVMREVDRLALSRETEATITYDEIHQRDRHRGMRERGRFPGHVLASEPTIAHQSPAPVPREGRPWRSPCSASSSSRSMPRS